ncbi:MAG: hypothetical protein COA78_26250 [Blastopirellula sp.]|nr:MAG: hypothetical protein COA78_26250 [Blastopirellula sp.]
MNCIRFCMATLAFSTLMLVGCGDGGSGNSVKGTIKFSDGSPVTSGSVTFESDSFSTFGGINSDGTVEIGLLDGGVPDGTYTVIVTSNKDTEGTDVEGESDYGESIPLVAENSTQVTIKGNQDFSVTVEKPSGAAAAPETAPETEPETTE